MDAKKDTPPTLDEWAPVIEDLQVWECMTGAPNQVSCQCSLPIELPELISRSSSWPRRPPRNERRVSAAVRSARIYLMPLATSMYVLQYTRSEFYVPL